MKNISSSSSDWSSGKKKHGNEAQSMIKSLLDAISGITESITCKPAEKHILNEIASYLYRASAIIMELQVNSNISANTVEALNRTLDLADGFNLKLLKNKESSEVGSTFEQLESVVQSIGRNLSLIPISTYLNQYIGNPAQALSKDMNDVSLAVKVSRDMAMEKDVPRDLYPINSDDTDLNNDTSRAYRTDSSQYTSEFSDKNGSGSSSSTDESWPIGMPQSAHYMEPLYATFFCPITKGIMDDPVTIESGVTYERKAITEWFDKNQDSVQLICPKSGRKLSRKILTSNIALKATIDEWKLRNETSRIKVARAALSLASTNNMVLEALVDLQHICKNKPHNKEKVHKIGITLLLAKLLKQKSKSIRYATLELLTILAVDDEKGKDFIANTVDVSTTIKMLSSDNKDVRHASCALLVELSKSHFFSEKIGKISGGILMLITVKYRRHIDAFSSEKAGQVLKNLEKLPENIKIMAENGYWEPLLTHLVEDDEEMKIEMASYLGEIVPGPESKTQVAERASPVLIEMVRTGKFLSRNAAFKALKQISSHHPNAQILAHAGILQIMVEEMFARIIYNEPMDLKIEAATILANILESGLELENFQADNHGHILASEYIIYSIIHRIKNSSPDDFNVNLIRILLCLMRSPKASSIIVSVFKEREAGYNLIELINTPNEELAIASLKLLIALSRFIGNTLSDKLRKTKGQPESLIQSPPDITCITEKQALSANFLAKLPHDNLTLNLALVNSNTIPTVIGKINDIRTRGTRFSRYANAYFESLLGILVRLTATLYDHQILLTARTYNFTSVFTELLMRSSTDEVQKLAAIGLENLSTQSIRLSRPPRRKKTKFLKIICFKKCISVKLSKDEIFSLCPIHGGICSAQDTFCLLDAHAIERLLACLNHENVEVIQPALSALSTLLDDKVNVQKSVKLLSQKGAIQHILNAVHEHKEAALLNKAIWVIEKFLMNAGDESFSYIPQDKSLPAIVVSAFLHGDDSTRKIAEKILRLMNKMPDLSRHCWDSSSTFVN